MRMPSVISTSMEQNILRKTAECKMARQGLTCISDKKKGWFIISEPQVALIRGLLMESGGGPLIDMGTDAVLSH